MKCLFCTSSQLLALLLLFVVLPILKSQGAEPSRELSRVYGTPGSPCSGVEQPCKAHLDCLNGVCTHVLVNQTCDPQTANSCGSDGLACLQSMANASNWRCALADLVPGETCYAEFGSQQCVAPARCLGGRCTGAVALGGNCTLGSRGECRAGLFCSLDRDGDSFGTCRQPVPIGHSCWPVRDMAWDTPNYVCAPGSSCIIENATAQHAVCKRLFHGNADRPCHVSDLYSSCDYRLRCEPIAEFHDPNVTTEGFVSGICVEYPSRLPDACSDDNQCPFGFMCTTVSARNSSSPTPRCRQFINTDCDIELHVYVSCLQDERCPFDDRSLIGNTGLLGAALPGSCSYESCRGEYEKLVCCQQKPRWQTYSYTPTWSLAKCDTTKSVAWPITVGSTLGVSVFVSISIILLLSWLKHRRLKAVQTSKEVVFEKSPLLGDETTDDDSERQE